MQMTATANVYENSQKASKNPALKDFNIYEELEMFKGEWPNYDVLFTDAQKDEILNFLNDLYTEMHSDRILSWNNDLYKNVKKDRNTFITEEMDEDRMVNIVGFMEMLVEMENSPFIFYFDEKKKLYVKNTSRRDDTGT